MSIAHTQGGRRVAVLAGLLVGMWVAALLGGTLVGTAAVAAGKFIHDGPASVPGFAELAGEFVRTWGTVVGTVTGMLALQDEQQAAMLAWPFVAGLIVSPLLMLAPLVGMERHRPSGIPLRWSIVGAGSLGGLLALAILLVPFDLVRWWIGDLGGDDPIRTLGEWNFYALLLAIWAVAGLVWARMLARAGRHGHPDRVGRFVRWLFAGTCVELALAAPTYALASRKSDCWCNWMSWWSIVAGTVILTVLCGPMLVLLWTREARLRWIRKACPRCGYPCRSASDRCTECGDVLPGHAVGAVRA
jgi:hypothetical protein